MKKDKKKTKNLKSISAGIRILEKGSPEVRFAKLAKDSCCGTRT